MYRHISNVNVVVVVAAAVAVISVVAVVVVNAPSWSCIDKLMTAHDARSQPWTQQRTVSL
jgi:hypothetical protein